MVTRSVRQRLAADWHNAGIRQGDVILLHTSIKRTLLGLRREKVECSPEDVLNSFIDSVGADGTLLLPTFDINVSPLVRFDVAASPSRMGVLTEVARQRSDFHRSRHPLLSFVARGPLARDFARCDDFTGIGHKSVFARLHCEGGKIGVLNLEEGQSMSFYHHVEFMLNVDYRWVIDFDAEIIDGPQIIRRRHGFYARKRAAGVVTAVERMGERLWANGCYVGDQWNRRTGLRVIAAHDVFSQTADVITRGQAKEYLYKIEAPESMP